MKKNIGKTDKMIRLIVAAILIILSLSGVTSGIVDIIVIVVAVILVATSLTGMCGLYTLFGIRTCPLEETTDSAINPEEEAFEDIPEGDFESEIPREETKEKSIGEIAEEDNVSTEGDTM